MTNLNEFEKKIKYEFQDKSLLKHALIHSSYANEKHMKKFSDNEKLEFLGDAVLELVSSEFLYHTYTKMSEGDLSKLRASLVCEPTLAYCTKAIDLDRYVFLGKGEEQTGGRQRKSILSDALEAVIGAIFLGGGIEPAKAFILEFILTDIEHKRLFHDSKTTLQEVTQAMFGKGVTYVVVSESGPDHAKEYGVKALVDEEVLGEGVGSSKKSAEQEAAYQALLKLHMENKINIVNK